VKISIEGITQGIKNLFNDKVPLRHEIPREFTRGPHGRGEFERDTIVSTGRVANQWDGDALLSKPLSDMTFDEYEEYEGEVFDHTLPHARDLDNGLLQSRVFDYMSSGEWHTLADISFACAGSEASVSARLRDFRKEKYGAHRVDRKHVGNRVYKYRLLER
jgi:hypothetical protein